MDLEVLQQPLGCYVHIPFCLSKCYYCDFLSQSLDRTLAQRYLAALETDIRFWGKRFGRPPVETIYFGGGTPSILEPEELKRLLLACREAFRVLPGAEISLEANPGTLSEGKLAALRGSGFTRISMGVQSMNSRLLMGLGRAHSPEDVVGGMEILRRTGWDNVNLDLMFGIPGQRMSAWRETVNAILRFRPEHLSAYSLIVEEGTLFGRLNAEGRLSLPPDSQVAAMYRWLVATLAAAGYRQYEISNFALPGRECRHNLRYWRFLDYVGVGVGAVSYLEGVRFRKSADLRRYVEGMGAGDLPLAEVERLNPRGRLAERLMMGLRLTEGVGLAELPGAERAIYEMAIAPTLAPYREAGLLDHGADRLRLTDRGILLANEVLQSLF